MQNITLAIATFGCTLILLLPGYKVLLVYTLILLYYPTFLVVSFGPLDFSASRLCILALLIKLLQTKTNKNRINNLDKCIFFYSFIAFIIPVIFWNTPILSTAILKSGNLFDSFIPFVFFRLFIRSNKDLTEFASMLVLLALPLAIMGVIESKTGWKPFEGLTYMCPWLTDSSSNLTMRHGFHRAVGPLSHPILFGGCLAMIYPFIDISKWNSSVKLFLRVILILGVLSSMSSGPWMMIILLLFISWLKNRKSIIKPIFISLIGVTILITILSNRPFYHVIASYVNPLGGSGWHRAKLIDNAIEHFREWCFVGYKGMDPGWGASMGMTWTDITNHYIKIGVYCGITGIILFISVFYICVKMLYIISKYSNSEIQKNNAWALLSLLVMLLVVYNSCTFFAQANTMLFIIWGIIASFCNINFNTLPKSNTLT